VVVIVEEPAVETGFAQRGLNRVELHTGILRAKRGRECARPSYDSKNLL
jgi:hypothetical protein